MKMLSMRKIAVFKERIIENFDMMIDKDTPSAEVMCAYLRAVDSLAQVYVAMQRDAIEKESEQ